MARSIFKDGTLSKVRCGREPASATGLVWVICTTLDGKTLDSFKVIVFFMRAD